MERDTGRLAEDLRNLVSMQDKVVRLHYALGCERAHTAREIARAMAVSPTAIRGVLQEAQHRLSAQGWTPKALRSAALLTAKQPLEWNGTRAPCRQGVT